MDSSMLNDQCLMQAEKEPILSSFLYASILAHENLEQSLGFVLANRLHNATLLATQLVDIFNEAMTNDAGIRRAIRLDMQVMMLDVCGPFVTLDIFRLNTMTFYSCRLSRTEILLVFRIPLLYYILR